MDQLLPQARRLLVVVRLVRRQLRQIQLAFLARVIINPMLGTGSLFFANFNHIKSSGGSPSSSIAALEQQRLNRRREKNRQASKRCREKKEQSQTSRTRIEVGAIEVEAIVV